MLKKCDFNELFIEQFADKELDYLESAEVAAHIKGCPLCRKKYEDILLTKKASEVFAGNEKLSLIEKEGFLSLIEQKSKKNRPLIDFIKGLFQNRAVTLAFSFASFACLVFAFVFSISGVEKENSIIINEIISAHNQRPAAKITLDSNEDNIRGTLFLSKRNEQLEKLFSESDCLVKKDDICKARHRSDNGKELIYWQNSGNNYLMVSDESNAAAKMVKLINTNF